MTYTIFLDILQRGPVPVQTQAQTPTELCHKQYVTPDKGETVQGLSQELETGCPKLPIQKF